MIFYPHYCYKCGFSWPAAKRLEKCPMCGSKDVVNCFRELGKKKINANQRTKTSC